MARVEIGPKDGYLGDVVTITLGPVEAGELRAELYALDADRTDGIAAEVWAKLGMPSRAPEDNPCPYTHSHTRHWCGYDGCRES
jgi:hypothetical protein